MKKLIIKTDEILTKEKDEISEIIGNFIWDCDLEFVKGNVVGNSIIVYVHECIEKQLESIIEKRQLYSLEGKLEENNIKVVKFGIEDVSREEESEACKSDDI